MFVWKLAKRAKHRLCQAFGRASLTWMAVLATACVMVGRILCLGLVMRFMAVLRAPLSWLAISSQALLTSAIAQSVLSSEFAATSAPYSPKEQAGREIWMFATALNDRFFTYTYPPRLGAAIDWYRVLRADRRNDLFEAWGAIPDPDCCVPGAAGCTAKSADETFGFAWCPGDSELLKFVGKAGYRDPACDFQDAPFNPTTQHGPMDQRQDRCGLKFGTSAGALGFRKFPNPRFDPAHWKIAGSWEGLTRFLSFDPKNPDSRINRLFDPSIEPPFRIGVACGACHISYDPLNPPADPHNPKWENIKELVGNQYSRISNLLGSGMSKQQFEWQAVARARPGVVNTSALPMDFFSNPGTMNAIINFAQRPQFEHDVLKWRKVAACPGGLTTDKCWCEPARAGKCWQRTLMKELVPHILKGGEDSIGYLEAIQRVYFNIGSCAEQCWVNHVPDLRAADPGQRNYGQTPFDIGQCRRDCASFRAIEDRLEDVAAFVFTARPTDLWKARRLSSPRDLEIALDADFFGGAVAEGRRVYAQNCASCHSSQKGPFVNADFHATDPKDPTLRLDWLGSDEVRPDSEIGTYPARALHSNHMQSRVWEQYASLTRQARPADPNRPELMKGGGRGYYRNISLLSAWAHAPFMHNNAIGPEICGKPSVAELDFYSSPYVDEKGQPLKNPPGCWPFDPSVEGRYKLYVASMVELLNPAKRLRKVFTLDEDLVIDVAPKAELLGHALGFSIIIPKGFPAVAINSLRYKDLIQDLALTTQPNKFEEKYQAILTAKQRDELRQGLEAIYARLKGQKELSTIRLVLGKEDAIDAAQDTILSVGDGFIQRFYSNVLSTVENAGHEFGAGLSEREKQALIAFVATL